MKGNRKGDGDLNNAQHVLEIILREDVSTYVFVDRTTEAVKCYLDMGKEHGMNKGQPQIARRDLRARIRERPHRVEVEESTTTYSWQEGNMVGIVARVLADHVQANAFTVKERANRVVTGPSKDFKSGQGAAGVIQGPNRELLEDERKKQIYRNF
ncbi:hypothetical protein STAS_06572 [Striga asiatica]|uniref:Uncharacterized protein n=1 Tax=Striga asiatica TaxID=4170 RepID=A0A5A7PD52_STRAF|nr:hypothetical protein STAS_06572 [Striga asiatica]